MATSFILTTDFIGEINISQNQYTTSDLQSIIESTERLVLSDLLGEDLYAKLIADLDVNYVPQTVKYLTLVNGGSYTATNGEGTTVTVTYRGIKQMLKYFTYYYYVKNQMNQNTIAGTVINSQENAIQLNKAALNDIVNAMYNKGVDLYGKKLYASENPSISVKIIDDTYIDETVKGNCYNFLIEYKDADYPTWMFTEKKKIHFNGSF